MKRLVEIKASIEGPAGRIEALVSEPESAPAVAVLCHPHPQHGGTMNNKVVHTLARTLAGTGFATIRFNFRGVGESEGSYADGRGEVDDARAIIDHARQHWPGLPVWLGGFSFGAMVAIVAAAQQDIAGLVSVAPPVDRMDIAEIVQPRCRWLILIGDEDELVDVDTVVEWVNRLDPGPQLRVLEGVDHFFHGRLIQLGECVQAWMDEETAT